tara:strand:+ start:1320 stop:2705 length:1386 start_codon:yes stop_codon:yes gene_type:complete
MTGSLHRRLTGGLAANALSQIIAVVIQLSGVPLFLYFWGANLYGEWLILFAIPAYLALSDVGFATAATNEMAMMAGSGKREEATTIFHSVGLLISIMSTLLLAIILILVFSMPIGRWFNFSQIEPGEIQFVLIFLSLQVISGLQTSILHAGFTCEGHYGLGTLCLGSIRLLEFGLLAGVIIFGGGPVLAAGAFMSGRMVGYLAMRQVLRKKVAWLSIGYRRAQRETIKSLWRPSVAFMGFPLGNFFNLQGSILIVGAVAGPSAVAIYSSLRTLSRLIVQFVNAINLSVRPEISRAFGQENTELLRKIHCRTLQSSIWIAALMVLFLALFGDLIVDLWTVGKIQVNNPLFIGLLLVALVNALWWGSLSILYATNRHQNLAIMYVVTNILFIGLAYPLIVSVGISGAAIALLAIEIVLAIYTIGSVLSFIEERPGRLFVEVIKPPLFLFDQVKSYLKNRSSPY